MKLNKKFIALLIMGAFVISAGISMGVAYEQQGEEAPVFAEVEEPDDDDDDDDDDEVDDEYEDEHGREVKVEFSDSEIQIESELKNGASKDSFQIKIEADDKLGIKLEYESETETDGSEVELEIEFKVVFKALIEFIDIDADGIFNENIDEEVQDFRLDDFSPIEYLPEVQADNSTLHYLRITTTDGVFTAHLFVAGEFMSLNTTVLTPTEIKIDIEIQDFPYMNDSSQLALYTKIESEYELEEEDHTENEENGFATDESGLESDMDGFMAGFSWAEQAEVDGMIKNVTVSPVDVDDESPADEKIYIVYPRGTHIYHDPKIGVLGLLDAPPALNGSILDSIPGYSLWAVFAASVALMSMLAYSKRRVQK
ncbi:MAG: hypothetical protein ACTSRK_08010 [Promethearchaeota archaeon]